MKPVSGAVIDRRSQISFAYGENTLNVKLMLLARLHNQVAGAIHQCYFPIKRDMYINSFPDRMDISNQPGKEHD